MLIAVIALSIMGLILLRFEGNTKKVNIYGTLVPLRKCAVCLSADVFVANGLGWPS